MRLNRGRSTPRPAERSKRAAPSLPTARATLLHWRTALIILVVVGAPLMAWRVVFRRAPEPLPLPANLEQLDAEVVRLIRAKAEQVEADPYNPATYGDLGLAYEANQLWNDARAAYSRAVELQPDDRLWRLHLAIATQEVGNFPTALSELRTLAETELAFAPVQQRLGYALLETGEWDAARTAFERVIKLEPKAADGYVGLASVCLRQQDADQAARLLEQALTLDPQYAVAHHMLGTAYRQLGREQDASKHLALGLDAKVRDLSDPLTPRLAEYAVNVRAQVATGARQLANGQTEQAIRTLEQVLQTDPQNVSALNNLAVGYVRQQRLEDAHQLLLKALQIDPHKYLTYIHLANWAKLTGDADQALRFANEAVQRAPQLDQTHRTRAVLLAQVGRIEDALASASQAATLNPRDPRTQSLCADLCLRLGRYTEAQSYFRRATELSPDRVEAWLGLAQACRAAGALDDAARALERARQLAPDDAQVRKAIERLRVQTATGN